MLKFCDELRDNQLPSLGVLLDDQDGRAVIKYVGKEEASKERERLVQAAEEKKRLKEEKKKKQEEAKVGYICSGR